MNTLNDPKGAAGALKTPLGLIPPYAMEQTAWAHKLGSDKYGPYNWRKTGVCASTYVNAILRHLNAWRDGETLDPESGISHLAHVACSCNILLDADYCGTLQDDRNVKPEPVEIPDEEPEQPVETEYRFLKEGEIIQEGDEYYTNHWWYPTSYNSYEECPVSPYPSLYRRKVEPEQPVETEYRFLEMGELIQEGDEYYGGNRWYTTNYNPVWGCTASASNVYRRKDERKQDCTCGRIKINHHTLGWICEDCKWHGEPY
jgi:hypothetical protein